MMKLASLAFVLLLLGAHAAGDNAELLGQPLSMFRDGEQGWLGYALFAVLLLISALYLTALARAGRGPEAAVAAVAALMLSVVAVTPSWGGFHIFCSLLLLGVLFSYYALLLHRAAGFGPAATHLSIPLALAFATGLHSYGLWQKAVITYIVTVTALHHLLGRPRARPAWATAGARAARGARPGKRHKVYQLAPSREWARRRAAPG